MLGFFKRRKQEELVAFCEGKIVALEKVEDQVFSTKLMGDGIAISPTGNGDVYAPLSGKVKSIFPTKHAFILEDERGTEYLLHCGLDTVELKGQGFTSMVDEGDVVKQGQTILNMDIATIMANGKDTVVIMVSENLFKDRKISVGDGEMVKKGDLL